MSQLPEPQFKILLWCQSQEGKSSMMRPASTKFIVRFGRVSIPMGFRPRVVRKNALLLLRRPNNVANLRTAIQNPTCCWHHWCHRKKKRSTKTTRVWANALTKSMSPWCGRQSPPHSHSGFFVQNAGLSRSTNVACSKQQWWVPWIRNDTSLRWIMAVMTSGHHKRNLPCIDRIRGGLWTRHWAKALPRSHCHHVTSSNHRRICCWWQSPLLHAAMVSISDQRWDAIASMTRHWDKVLPMVVSSSTPPAGLVRCPCYLGVVMKWSL